MRNKTIAVIADKRTGAIKSIETGIILSEKESKEQMIWECKISMENISIKRNIKY